MLVHGFAAVAVVSKPIRMDADLGGDMSKNWWWDWGKAEQNVAGKAEDGELNRKAKPIFVAPSFGNGCSFIGLQRVVFCDLSIRQTGW